jgi:hypothetical protein
MLRRFFTAVVVLVALAIIYLVAYTAVSLAWFGLVGANPKIGPEDIGVPLVIYHLVTTGLASGLVGLLASAVGNPNRSGRWVIRVGTVAVTAGFIAIYVLGFGGRPDQNPFYILVPVLAAVALRATSDRRTVRAPAGTAL